MSKKEIANDLTEGATKAVQLHDGRFVTQSLYYQHKMQVLKMYLSWHDIKRIVEIANKTMPSLDHELQSEEAYFKEILKKYLQDTL